MLESRLTGSHAPKTLYPRRSREAAPGEGGGNTRAIYYRRGTLQQPKSKVPHSRMSYAWKWHSCIVGITSSEKIIVKKVSTNPVVPEFVSKQPIMAGKSTN